MPSQERTSRSAPKDQVYLTHCLLVDSVFNIAEFTVRAASTSDHDLLRRVDRYPTFELPVTLWSKDPQPEKAPRRLALVNLDDGEQILIHSAYLTRDTVGRVGNHFTHVLIAPRFDPLEAIQSWAAPGWRTGYEPGESKMLPQPKGIPAGSVLNDDHLREFLSGEHLPLTDPDLATQTIPERLLNEPRRRRELLARFLNAILFLVQQEDKRRGPLYIHAEPGLVALFLFAAFRLLPRGWTSELTFTTYENPDTTLRSYDRALIVGTYMDDPRRRLEEDYRERYGYGFDTFHFDCCSTELATKQDAVEALLDLAAEGDWEVIDRLHEKCGNARVKVAGIREASRRIGSLVRLPKLTASIEELATILTTEEGRKQFEPFEAGYWPRIRDACLANPALAPRFTSTLRKENYLKELRRTAAQQLADIDLPGWERHWALIRSVVASREKEQFRKLVDDNKLGDHPSPDVKSVLRREWLKWEMRDKPGKLPDSPPWGRALRAESEAELARLLNDPELPFHWKARSLCYAMLSTQLIDAARAHLQRAEATIFEAALQIGKAKFHEHPAFLVKLLAGEPPPYDLMARLLATGTKYIEAQTWVAIFRGLNHYNRAEWESWWLQNEHLAQLLVNLDDVPAARDIWEPYVQELVNKRFLVDLRLIRIYVQIMRAYERLCIKIVDTPEYVLLSEEISALERIRVNLALDYPEVVFNFPDVRPMLESILTYEALRLACKHWPEGDKSQVEPLRKRFHGELHKTNVVYAQLRPNDESDRKRLDMFFHEVFQRFYPMGEEDLWPPALMGWCRMIRDCTPEKQLVLQKYFRKELNPTIEQWYNLRMLTGNAMHPSLIQQIETEYAELQQRRKTAFNFDEPEPEEPGEGGDFNFDPSAPGKRRKRK